MSSICFIWDFFFFWLRMKKARVGLLITLIFSGCKSGSLFVFCFLFFWFFGVFKLSHTEYEFNIWTFKHHSWFSILVLNYHWILHLFFFSFFCWSNCIWNNCGTLVKIGVEFGCICLCVELFLFLLFPFGFIIPCEHLDLDLRRRLRLDLDWKPSEIEIKGEI